ncbi:hypothetical protein U9M48_045081 [Paspalum notatum var. saurae]|uniref:Uncharacterized protein n=1 Tax=Paspalum notatum var. saurae TaxID=547442 RepID=A0AAQ3UWC7_PASNO
MYSCMSTLPKTTGPPSSSFRKPRQATPFSTSGMMTFLASASSLAPPSISTVKLGMVTLLAGSTPSPAKKSKPATSRTRGRCARWTSSAAVTASYASGTRPVTEVPVSRMTPPPRMLSSHTSGGMSSSWPPTVMPVTGGPSPTVTSTLNTRRVSMVVPAGPSRIAGFGPKLGRLPRLPPAAAAVVPEAAGRHRDDLLVPEQVLGLHGAVVLPPLRRVFGRIRRRGDLEMEAAAVLDDAFVVVVGACAVNHHQLQAAEEEAMEGEEDEEDGGQRAARHASQPARCWMIELMTKLNSLSIFNPRALATTIIAVAWWWTTSLLL